MVIQRFAAILLAAVFCAGAAQAYDREKYDPENLLYMELKSGRVVIELRPDLAPNSVARIKELSRQGFYDGHTFHRVLEDFMAQTGDPKGDGTGGSGQNLKAEFNNARHLRGTVSMARGTDEDSADSQFFIMLMPKPALDNRYTVVGRVLEGMEHVDKIKLGDKFDDGRVEDPDSMISLRVAADVERLRRQ